MKPDTFGFCKMATIATVLFTIFMFNAVAGDNSNDNQGAGCHPGTHADYVAAGWSVQCQCEGSDEMVTYSPTDGCCGDIKCTMCECTNSDRDGNTETVTWTPPVDKNDQ